MARADQFPDDGGADEPCRSRDEDTHKTNSLLGAAPAIERRSPAMSAADMISITPMSTTVIAW
jgi:hypothetical protein